MILRTVVVFITILVVVGLLGYLSATLERRIAVANGRIEQQAKDDAQLERIGRPAKGRKKP